MTREKWLEKVEQKLRNENIAKLYFVDDMSATQIKNEYYPELTSKRIFSIAKAHIVKYGKFEDHAVTSQNTQEQSKPDYLK